MVVYLREHVIVLGKLVGESIDYVTGRVPSYVTSLFLFFLVTTSLSYFHAFVVIFEYQVIFVV